MKQYLLDTVTLVRHFSGKGYIGAKASAILNADSQADNQFCISVITLMEVMYLAERNRIEINFQESLRRINESAMYLVVNLGVDILRVAENMAVRELHDRLILPTAKWLDVPVLSSDAEFSEIPGIHLIWI